MKQMLILSLISLIIKSVFSKGEFYDYSNQICCDGILYNRPADNFTFHCCNSTLLKNPVGPNEEQNAPLCCNGRVFERLEESTSCCGSQIYSYNNKSLTCQYDQIIIIPKEKQLQNKTQVCGADANNYTLYNYQESVCCSGTLYDIRENFQCCGSYQYDTRYSACCGNDVVYIGESAKNYDSCCGSQPYDTDKDFCCTQYSNSDPNNPYRVTGWGLYPMTRGDWNDYTCCGLHLMKNDRTQVCCDSGPKESFGADSCCGEDLIDASKNEICVGGMKQISGQIYDCNGQSYNNSVHFCVENQLYKLDKYMDVCAVNGQTVVFYITEQGCTKTGLIDKPAELRGNPHLYCTTWAETNPTFFFKR